MMGMSGGGRHSATSSSQNPYLAWAKRCLATKSYYGMDALQPTLNMRFIVKMISYNLTRRIKFNQTLSTGGGDGGTCRATSVGSAGAAQLQRHGHRTRRRPHCRGRLGRFRSVGSLDPPIALTHQTIFNISTFLKAQTSSGLLIFIFPRAANVHHGKTQFTVAMSPVPAPHGKCPTRSTTRCCR